MSKKDAPMAKLVQFNVRVPETLVDRLERLSKDMNAELGWEKYTRSDLARDILLEGVEAREKKRPKR